MMQAGYNRRDRNYVAVHAAYMEVIARAQPTLIIQLIEARY